MVWLLLSAGDRPLQEFFGQVVSEKSGQCTFSTIGLGINAKCINSVINATEQAAGVSVPNDLKVSLEVDRFGNLANTFIDYRYRSDGTLDRDNSKST